MLVCAPGPETNAQGVHEHMSELTSLTDTAGAEIVGTLKQRIDTPHPAYYIGTGKVRELKDVVEQVDATLVIFDEDLSPVQGQKLERDLGVRVMDRTELIIDIFALRARTAEAKMQVELAQLHYMMPRLKRLWSHLSRIRGGIGLRGPGETQLETDRRMIRRRIGDLKRRLERVATQRLTQRKGRTREFQVALVGYTNGGKSSILAKLSESELFVEDRLFATVDPATRVVDLGDGFQALVTDTVGFIRKLPHDLVASFRATLEEVGEADLLCQVIDVSHVNWEQQYEVVEGVLAELGIEAQQKLALFNKVDRLTHDEEQAIAGRASAILGPNVFTSTREADGLEPLRTAIRETIRQRWPEVRLTLPAADGSALAEVYREGEVLTREENGERIALTVRLPSEVVGRLRARQGLEFVDRMPD